MPESGRKTTVKEPDCNSSATGETDSHPQASTGRPAQAVSDQRGQLNNGQPIADHTQIAHQHPSTNASKRARQLGPYTQEEGWQKYYSDNRVIVPGIQARLPGRA
ncbi:Hypothetical predicted protein [Pelobates cultripes]|uniref:Uncharacterized protein n=1 Tax=Pelobates cultripes TaxID=61616 RepID=A0AAD1SMH8_PELCU|nr:Hypothetical predicted protein [Pelobates cultripes]